MLCGQASGGLTIHGWRQTTGVRSIDSLPIVVGKALKNYDEQIAAIDSKIEKYEGYISDLKVKRQELVGKQQQSMKDLQEYMTKNNLAPDEVIAKLQAAK